MTNHKFLRKNLKDFAHDFVFFTDCIVEAFGEQAFGSI